jgi:preprotein translocase subunit SecA
MRRSQTLGGSSDRQLREYAKQMWETGSGIRLARRSTPDRTACVEALAIADQAVTRQLGLSLYPVQLAGAYAAALGWMIEMQTGEGKTLVAAAAATAAALCGSRVHVATTNAYLAGRDRASVQPVFELLGLGVGCLQDGMELPAIREAYEQPVVYGTGYQFGFDYLFDQITLRRDGSHELGRSVLQAVAGIDPTLALRQRFPFDGAIIDEADSVLIDEALTPLVVSVDQVGAPERAPYELARKLAQQLRPGVDYLLESRELPIRLTPAGQRQVNAARGELNGQRLLRPWVKHVTNAISAEFLFKRNHHYVVDQDRVKIVDALTGRIFEDRSWEAGLHQAVETKEGVPLTSPRVAQARITRQGLIGRYRWVGGMSGTLNDAASEIGRSYGCRVLAIPTHHASRRRLLPCQFFRDWEIKLHSMLMDIRQRHRRGQPILIGTQTIERSLQVADYLEQAGLRPVVLNGLQDQAEAEIVSEAGSAGRITIATNMAGRGTDIKLSPRAREAGGLHVIGSEPNDCRRVDRQLVGRAGRQGDPGSAQFFVSADDTLLIRRAPWLADRIKRGCDQRGWCRQDLTPWLMKVQRGEEQRQMTRRQAMVRHERWMRTVRDSVFSEL